MLKKITAYFCFFFCCLSAALSASTPLPDSIPPSSKKLRFFNVDLHISVIADVKDIFESFGHEVVDWTLSGHSWVFDRPGDPVEVVNAGTWQSLNREMCNQFYRRYADFLSQFDGFIVTYSGAFALLYEKLNKPIVIVNPTRYEVPFTRNQNYWDSLDDYLREGVEKNKIFIVSNNKGDQFYLKHYTGIDHEHVPSLCLYTNQQYTGNRAGFIVQAIGNMTRTTMDRFKNKQLIQNANLPHRYKWNALYDFQGIIHYPYNVSTMSLFEQYSANIPLFFPSKKFIYQLKNECSKDVLSSLSFVPYIHPNIPEDPNNVNDPKVVQRWVDSADFYDEENMPYIQYFDSFEHLEHLLQTVNLREISQKMKEHNVKRKVKVFKQWSDLLERVIQSRENGP